jgi:hypothetical protein
MASRPRKQLRNCQNHKITHHARLNNKVYVFLSFLVYPTNGNISIIYWIQLGFYLKKRIENRFIGIFMITCFSLSFFPLLLRCVNKIDKSLSTKDGTRVFTIHFFPVL